MNLFCFIAMLIIPYQGTNGTLLIDNGLPTFTFGSYNETTKELNLEYTCIYRIGTTYFDFGQVVETTTTRDKGFKDIYLTISDVYIVSPTSAITIYQATHTYFYNYADINRNHSITTQISKEITNPISSTFTIHETDTTFTSLLLKYDNASYESGFNTGYDLGYQIGHDNGYESGEASGNAVNNVITWFKNIWNALSGFLSLEIAPNIKIFEVITIPIVIAVLMFVLKALIK